MGWGEDRTRTDTFVLKRFITSDPQPFVDFTNDLASNPDDRIITTLSSGRWRALGMPDQIRVTLEVP